MIHVESSTPMDAQAVFNPEGVVFHNHRLKFEIKTPMLLAATKLNQ